MDQGKKLSTVESKLQDSVKENKANAEKERRFANFFSDYCTHFIFYILFFNKFNIPFL